jgi:hypothetical protein
MAEVLDGALMDLRAKAPGVALPLLQMQVVEDLVVRAAGLPDVRILEGAVSDLVCSSLREDTLRGYCSHQVLHAVLPHELEHLACKPPHLVHFLDLGLIIDL